MHAYLHADDRLGLLDWTVGDLLADAARQAPNQVALTQRDFVNGDDLQWSYAQLLADSRRLAQYLAARFARHEPVAIWGGNSAAWVLYQLAAAQAGLQLVTLNPALRAAEVEYMLTVSGAAGLIMDREHRGTDLTAIVSALRPKLTGLRDVLMIEDWRHHLSESSAAELPRDISPDEIALVLFTSGTTGKPKAVMLHHRGIVNNAVLGSQRYGLAKGRSWLHTLPMFHVGGSVTASLGCMAQLGNSVMLPAFDAGIALRLCAEEQIAWLPVVPTILIAMVEHENFARTDLSKLEVLLTGGTVITPEFVRMAAAKLGAAVQVIFGQTEAGGGMAKTLRSDSAERIAATAGIPYPHTAIKIARVSDGAVAERCEIGELCIRSPFMMRGYLNNPEANEKAFDSQGFLRTGDLGMIDEDGYIRVTGRLKEMIIRGGENIYPREVEDALGEYPGVAEVAVFGVPDEKWGEAVAAAVRPAAGETLDAAALEEFLKARIARYKVPKYWRMVAEFPRTPSGKIQKFELAARLELK